MLLAVWGNIMQQCLVELKWINNQTSFAFMLADAVLKAIHQTKWHWLGRWHKLLYGNLKINLQ